MKKIYLLFLLVFSVLTANAQGATCATSEPFCSESSTLIFPNQNGNIPAESGIDYGCLFIPNNPSWFTITATFGGDLSFTLSQINDNGVPLDVDFILWGPFFSEPACGSASLNASTTMACSYSTNTSESFIIPAAPQGSMYKLMITNFSNQPGEISMTQTNAGQPGAGSTQCPVLCDISLPTYYFSCAGNILGVSPQYPGATYQWSSDNGPLPDTGPFIYPTEAGTYTVTVTAPGCDNIMTATGAILPYQDIFADAVDLTACSTGTTAEFDLSINTPIISLGMAPENYGVTYHISQTDAQNFINPIANATNYTGFDGQAIYAAIEDYNYGCITVRSFMLHILGDMPQASVSVDDQLVVVEVTPAAGYQYSIDGGVTWQDSNVFENVPLGLQTILVQSVCGIITVDFTVDTPNAPFGMSPQYFTQGETLANLEMSGENVQWYDNLGRMLSDTPLPLSTILTHNTTYFATQTVNGAESTNRFPVLVFDSSLAIAENVFSGLSYHPNPTAKTLSVVNSQTISACSIFSVCGQLILAETPNDFQTNIDVSRLQSGIYFLKLESGSAQKTIRFIKQ